MVSKLLILVMLLSSVAYATRPGEPHCENRVLDAYLVRDSSRVFEGFSQSSLVQYFESQHIQRFQQGLVAWKTFYPFWVFQSRGLLEELFAAFPLSDDHQVERTSAEYHFLEEFLDRWEKDFKARRGSISSVWMRTRKMSGKKRFLQRYYLELAEYHTRPLGLSADEATQFTPAPDSPLSYLAGSASIILHFGSTDNFLKQLRTFIRVRRQAPVASRTYPYQASLIEARQQMTAMGATPARTRPLVQEDERINRQRELLSQSVMTFNLNSGEIAPLALLCTESTNTGHWPHYQLSYLNYEEIQNVFGSLEAFMTKVNQRIRPAITQGNDAFNWEGELLIQAGIQTVLDTGQLVEELEINADDRLLRTSHETAGTLRVKIARRLRDLFGE